MIKVLSVNNNSKYLKDALLFYGYEVETVSEGMQALKLLLKFPERFDIVLLDAVLPHMNGLTVLNTIRKNAKTKNIPVIMFSAINDTETMVSGLKAGADDYIIKPFVLANLLARMDAVLRRSYRHKEYIVKNLNFTATVPKKHLTEREREVLTMAAKGSSNKDIADKLYVKEVTVKTHLNNIFKKLKVTSRTQAILLAIQTDLVSNK